MPTETGSTRVAAVIALAAFVIAFAIVLSGRTIGPASFKALDLAELTKLLAPLLLVALLIERAIEVFFGVWREPDDRVAEHAADVATVAAMSAVPAAVVDAQVKQAVVETRKATNTRLAFLMGGTFGIVAALAGVRVLALLVNNAATVPRWWTLLDVLLTAGLLGGGADGFHHITAALKSFFTATQQKAKDAATVSKLNSLAPAALPNGRAVVAVEVK